MKLTTLITASSLALILLLGGCSEGSGDSNGDHDGSTLAYDRVGPYATVRDPDQGLRDGYVIYRPDTQIGPDTPVVLFLEGGGSAPHIDDYRGVMRFLATRGYFVIGAESGESYDSGFAADILDQAVDEARNLYGLNLERLAVMGHSQGGGQAFFVMRHMQERGFGQEASLILSIDGWFAFSMNRSDLASLEGRVAFVQMNGTRGTGTDPRIDLSIWNLARKTRRSFLVLPENQHGYLMGSLSDLDRSKKDLLFLLGALTDDAFNDRRSGYEAIDQRYKSSYEEIKSDLLPEDRYEDDCAGNAYNARSWLEHYDIDYCDFEPS